MFLARIVIPFSRSRSVESSTRSPTSWFSRKAPDCQSIASTSVVLPWSTCATIATLRRSERKAIAARVATRLRASLRFGDLGVPLGDAAPRPSAPRSASGRCGSSSPSSIRIWCTDASMSRSATVRCSATIVIAATSSRSVVREIVDLRLRRLAAREHAEVDADVSVVVEKGDLREILHRNPSRTPTYKSSNARAAPSRSGARATSVARRRPRRPGRRSRSVAPDSARLERRRRARDR